MFFSRCHFYLFLSSPLKKNQGEPSFKGGGWRGVQKLVNSRTKGSRNIFTERGEISVVSRNTSENSAF